MATLRPVSIRDFIVDTNVFFELTKPPPDSAVSSWVKSQEDLHLSVISIGELRRGFSLLPAGKRRAALEKWLEFTILPLTAGRMLPVTHAIADRWGSLGAECQLRGKPLPLAAGLITATALEHNLFLVTRNTRDFAGLGLDIFNPWQDTVSIP